MLWVFYCFIYLFLCFLQRIQQALTNPDNKRCSVLCRRQSRLDATLGFQNVSYDVARMQLKYTSRYVCILFNVCATEYQHKCNNFIYLCLNKESPKESTERSGCVWSGCPFSRGCVSWSTGGPFHRWRTVASSVT